MSSNDDYSPHSKTAKDSFLNELESIKGLLEDNLDDDLEMNIPILDDIVSTTDDDGNEHPASLLNLDALFGEDNHNVISADKAQPDLVAKSAFEGRELDLDDLEFEFDELENNAELDLDALGDLDNDPDNDLELDLGHLDINIDIPAFKLKTTLSDTPSDTPSDNSADEKPSLPDNDDYIQWITDSLPEMETFSASTTVSAANNPRDTGFDATGSNALAPDEGGANALDLTLLIQEIVDEFIPLAEDQLRQRLSQCSPQVIKQLAKKYLDH